MSTTAKISTCDLAKMSLCVPDRAMFLLLKLETLLITKAFKHTHTCTGVKPILQLNAFYEQLLGYGFDHRNCPT